MLSMRRVAGLALARLLLVVVVVVAAAVPVVLPATALAGTTPLPAPGTTNPLSPGVPVPQATTPSTTTATLPAVLPTTNTSSGSSGLSGSGTIAIAVVAALVLGGIAYFIWRDARRRAPVRHARGEVAGLPGGEARSGSKAPPKPRKLSPAERRRRKRGRAKR